MLKLCGHLTRQQPMHVRYELWISDSKNLLNSIQFPNFTVIQKYFKNYPHKVKIKELRKKGKCS